MDGNEEDETDETLDVESEKFDALRALYSKKLVVPFPSAPVLDNVAKANYLLSNNQNLVNKPRPPVKVKKEVEPSTSAERNENESEANVKQGRKPAKNALTRMADAVGPLAYLRTCMEKRVRVKVWTRRGRELRGHCLGFVAAFDKHWNLAMEDVQEVWSRPIKRKKFLLGEGSEMPIGWRAMGPAVKPPKVVVTGTGGRTETCQRHVAQMLVRGEQIAFISASDT